MVETDSRFKVHGIPFLQVTVGAVRWLFFSFLNLHFFFFITDLLGVFNLKFFLLAERGKPSFFD